LTRHEANTTQSVTFVRRSSLPSSMDHTIPHLGFHPLFSQAHRSYFIRFEDGGPLRPCALLNSHRCVYWA
ncbi:hypothetical protein AVEN_204113-1, partial [Araneus ventricosus]